MKGQPRSPSGRIAAHQEESTRRDQGQQFVVLVREGSGARFFVQDTMARPNWKSSNRHRPSLLTAALMRSSKCGQIQDFLAPERMAHSA